MVDLAQLASRLPVALEMRVRRWSEGADVRLAELLIHPDRLFVDIGANAGLYSWVARRQDAPVVAFEPHPAMARRLRQRLPGIEVREVALSDAAGTATLHVPNVEERELTTRSSLERDANEGFDHRAVTVEVRRLDDCLAERTRPVGFVKVDVEGHEDAVLAGATTTLSEDRPVVLIELEWRHHGQDVEQIVQQLLDAGYQGGFVLDGRHRPIEEFLPDQLQAPDNLKAPGPWTWRPRGPYVNNFLFVHVDDDRSRQLLAASGFSR